MPAASTPTVASFSARNSCVSSDCSASALRSRSVNAAEWRCCRRIKRCADQTHGNVQQPDRRQHQLPRERLLPRVQGPRLDATSSLSSLPVAGDDVVCPRGHRGLLAGEPDACAHLGVAQPGHPRGAQPPSAPALCPAVYRSSQGPSPAAHPVHVEALPGSVTTMRLSGTDRSADCRNRGYVDGG